MNAIPVTESHQNVTLFSLFLNVMETFQATYYLNIDHCNIFEEHFEFVWNNLM